LNQTIVELADVPAFKQSWEAAFNAQNVFQVNMLRQCWPDLSVLFESYRDMVDWIAAGRPEDDEEAVIAHLDAV